MATPFLQLQGQSLTIIPATPGSIFYKSLDASGNPVDISSGFTLSGVLTTPASDYNSDSAAVDISADVTATFSSTGLTLAWTGAQASAISGASPTLHRQMLTRVTNDSGTTKTLIGASALFINNFSGVL